MVTPIIPTYTSPNTGYASTAATVCILALDVMLIRDCSAQRGTHAINIFLRHSWKQRQAHGASPNVFSVREIAGLVPKLSEDLKQMHRRIVRANPDASIPHSRDKQPAGVPIGNKT